MDDGHGTLLAWLAAGAVGARLRGLAVPDAAPEPEPLREPGASFVTLECGGRLRGCVGSLDAVRPLWRDVVRNALRAMHDPRLPAVTPADWPELDVKVSVLTRPETVPVVGADDLLASLRPGVDGLLLTEGRRRASFLPAVWEKLPEPDRFLDALLVKGGWPAGYWSPGLRAQRYTTVEYRDPAPRTPLRG